jgi:hypothetical protein
VKIKTDEIASVIKQEIEQFATALEVSEVGRVVEVGDGIARIYGLSNAMAGELLEFQTTDGAVMGQVFNLELDTVGAVIYGDYLSVKEGDMVKSTGRLLEVPVGEALLGRVVDPLGRPIDDAGPINTNTFRKVDIIAPGIAERQPVTEPLQTGIKAIDAMIPIGRGQRELIIGDRKTGKTAVAIDTIINQKQYWGTPEAVVCVYVAVGQKESTVAGVVQTLKKAGAMDYTIIVNAGASDPAPMQYIAPYTGAPWPSTSCGSARKASFPSTPSASTTTCPSRPSRTASFHCCSAVPRAARRTPATCSISTAASSSAPPSSPTRTVPARSPRSPSSRRRKATCRRTSRPTSSPSPTARSTSKATCSSPASAPP